MELGERYYQLSLLGRDTFLDSVAQGALVRRGSRFRMARGTGTAASLSEFLSEEEETDMREIGSSLLSPRTRPTIFPLCKRPNTPFIDLITLGRTDSNDITVPDRSVSRFQAFFRKRFGRWFICDAGSKNGTRVGDRRLEPRTETEILSGQILQFGTVEVSFYTADSLYDALTSGTMR